jgi:hypothetical protein
MSRLYLSALSNRHSLSTANRFGVSEEAGKHFLEVPMIKLDTFMEQNKIQPNDVQFLRMDIEGYEVVAFQGMQKIMNAKTPFKIFMEFHPKYYGEWGWTFERLLDYLASCGFLVRGLAYERHGNAVALKDPTREQVLETQFSTRNNSGGSQAFLERP